MSPSHRPNPEPEESGALVVMEARAVWPARPLTGIHPVAVVAESGEHTPNVIRRAARRAKDFAAEGVPLRRAILSCAAVVDRRTLRKRLHIAQALLALLVAGGGGALVLTAPQSDTASRRALAALARSLDADLAGSGVSVELED